MQLRLVQNKLYAASFTKQLYSQNFGQGPNGRPVPPALQWSDINVLENLVAESLSRHYQYQLMFGQMYVIYNSKALTFASDFVNIFV